MISANIKIVKVAYTVADVRKWLDEVDSLDLPDTTVLDEDVSLSLSPATYGVDLISCGEHIPERRGEDYWLPNDIVVLTHQCRGSHADIPGKPE